MRSITVWPEGCGSEQGASLQPQDPFSTQEGDSM